MFYENHFSLLEQNFSVKKFSPSFEQRRRRTRRQKKKKHYSWGLHARNTRHGLPSLTSFKAKHGLSGKGIKICILDTGIFSGHENVTFIEAKNFTDSPFSFEDKVGHGTHCAGIATGDNKRGINTGVAHSADLYVAKILNDEGVGKFEWIVEGIKWAMSKGCDVLSLSLGSETSIVPLSIQEAFQEAMDQGAIICVAAGNSGPRANTIESPGVFTKCITVGAINKYNKLASFSSRGKEIDIVAPGVDILSCYKGKKNSYAYLSGTSMATPFVAGLCCLFLEFARSHGKVLDQGIMERLLKTTAIDLWRKGFEPLYGSGMIHYEKILNEIKKLKE